MLQTWIIAGGACLTAILMFMLWRRHASGRIHGRTAQAALHGLISTARIMTLVGAWWLVTDVPGGVAPHGVDCDDPNSPLEDLFTKLTTNMMAFWFSDWTSMSCTAGKSRLHAALNQSYPKAGFS
ncbi:MAG: hypothetical protein EA399_10705 [Desulfovibrionales bacterium]|nr:MAG: hypothetical protein EA399_10705 [Desulfovibrionales bacterium]